MRVVVLLVIAACGLPAQFSATPPAPDGPKQVVSGRVVDSRTARPIRGAKVAIWHGSGEAASALSDFEGRFRFDQAPVGEWRIGAEKSGYLNRFEDLVVPAAQPLAGLDLRIDRMPVITGRVVDHRDRPVVGAQVMALTRHYLDGQRVYIPRGGRGPFGGKTDDRGQYRIWGLTAGSYVLGVFPAASPAVDGVFRFNAVGALHPDSQSIAEAEKIDLDWGDVREGVDLRLSGPAPTRAEATIALPAAGAGCQPCFLQIHLDDPDGPIPVAGGPLTVDRILIEGAAPGGYIALLSAFDRATGNPSRGLERFTLANNRTESFAITLAGQVSVKGRVVLENPPDDLFTGENPWRADLRLAPPASQMALGNIGRPGFANLQAKGAETPFELASHAGEFRLKLAGVQGAYIAGAAIGGRPLEDPVLIIPSDGLADLVVRVRFDQGRVQGSVAGVAPSGPGLGGPRYVLNAEPAGAAGTFLEQRYLRVHSDGSFDEALPPGTWELVATSQAGFQRLAEPASATALRKFVRRVEVRPNETTTVNLPPVPEQ